MCIFEDEGETGGVGTAAKSKFHMSLVALDSKFTRLLIHAELSLLISGGCIVEYMRLG